MSPQEGDTHPGENLSVNSCGILGRCFTSLALGFVTCKMGCQQSLA